MRVLHSRALWKAEAVSYDAIILDLMLPGIDGLEVCSRLREARGWSAGVLPGVLN